jgi:hypothetical protein
MLPLIPSLLAVREANPQPSNESSRWRYTHKVGVAQSFASQKLCGPSCI